MASEYPCGTERPRLLAPSARPGPPVCQALLSACCLDPYSSPVVLSFILSMQRAEAQRGKDVVLHHTASGRQDPGPSF